jgi:nitrite reductase/ring-hydroxylating ferredoxin subunit
MAMEEILICESDAVVDGGKGVRFPVTRVRRPGTGFVVRYGGKPYAYLNRCAHVPIELDWAEGEFFESSGCT